MSNHRYRRTDLFLVRVWTQDEGSAGDSDGNPKARCYGRVQRVVSGEARQFDNWQALLDALNAMLLPSSRAGATTNSPQPEPDARISMKGANNEP